MNTSKEFRNITKEILPDFKHPNDITCYFSYLYTCFNRKNFPDKIYSLDGFTHWICVIYDTFRQPRPSILKYSVIDSYNIPYNNRVLLGFSGGLDSCFQAISLKDDYDIILYHVSNINRYENGISTKVSRLFSKKSKMKYVEERFRSTKLYPKELPENPIKNQLIIAMMLDYCSKANIYNITLGDPFNLRIDEATPGINLTDANEITEIFLDSIKYYYKFDYIPMKYYKDKNQELNYLTKEGYRDLFYSCIAPGRFNQCNHNRVESKYNIKIPQYNCGSCRKCCTQILLDYYDNNNKIYPEEYIDHCWRKLWDNPYSSEYFQFNPNISLENRIKNLHTT